MPDETNGSTPPEPQTFGRLAARLRSNGFDPVSALQPQGIVWLDVRNAVHFLRQADFVIAEHPVALRCFDTDSPLVLLAVAPIADAELSERVEEFLKRCKTSGPCRLSSDGVRVWPLRPQGHEPIATRRALGGAVMLEHCTPLGMGMGFQSTALLPLDGVWKNGSPLTVPRAALPEISADQAQKLVDLLEALPANIAAERQHQQPRPARRSGWIGQQ
jgi:hypothetical protein